tara:strand:+ start:72 stop:782 length:711 start_codon:yes stop_codon:yes gene_type:complete
MNHKPQSADMHPGPGFRIRQNIERPTAEDVARLARFATPDISDSMNRLYTMSRDITHLVGPRTVCGPVCTVEVYPGDNLMVHKVLDVAQPGDIVVVHGGSGPNGIIGDLIATKARHRGIAGFIVDGLVRDVAGIEAVGMPVFGRGVTPMGPLHRGPGEINYPISCGGTVVLPGDVVVADENGVVVVRRDFLTDLLERLEQRESKLADYVAAVQRGEFSNDWVDRTLDAGGCRREPD